MNSNTFGSNGCTFASTALGSDVVQVKSIRGAERIGQLYELTVTIVHGATPLTEAEISDLLLAPCALTIGGGNPINGIAREVSIQEGQAGGGVYDIVMVPTAWLLTISKLSRLYQTMSVKDMAAAVLNRYGLAGHFDLRVTASRSARLLHPVRRERLGFPPAVVRARGALLLVRAL